MPVTRVKPVPSDLAIAQAATILPIKQIASDVGLTEDDLDYYGRTKAKVHLDVRERAQHVILREIQIPYPIVSDSEFRNALIGVFIFLPELSQFEFVFFGLCVLHFKLMNCYGHWITFKGLRNV